MSVAEAVLVVLAGVAAGTINAVVGSGTLVTFPTLLAVGFSPVTANVSNTIGLVPGSISGAIGYREELRGQRARALVLGVMSVFGGLTGGVLLLTLPEGAFRAIVPVFIVLALGLVIVQPRLARRLAHRRRDDAERGLLVRAAVFATGVYGGYFGAAQGIMLLGVLGVAIPDDLHRINALKNVLAGAVNLVSGVLFAIVADVAWEAVGLIAAGSIVGGQLGARYGRRLPAGVLRGVIVAVGLTAIALLVR